ncbi:MAG: UDP-N-acetylmuramoyl-L-alanine--D-glutamate ligase [Candidatus Cloacimonadota bacterium]|nr:UDP-N-acetylmuramoyl-L-alanine--D-glutamate ligase [Candidatus Cloacimonadota bacterium]
MFEFIDLKFSVLGLARSGKAAAKKLKELGNTPFISENTPLEKLEISNDFLQNFSYEVEGHTDKVLDADVIVISPGIPLNIEILQKAREKKIPIWSELELGYQILKKNNAKLIAVTGSNGKSTTVSLIHHILRNAKKRSILAGNIGNPLTSFPIEKDIFDFIVVEVSSFQLDTIHDFKPDIAILLNITPDHLNRYDSFADYKLSKLRIFENQNPAEHQSFDIESEKVAHESLRVKNIGIINLDNAVCNDIYIKNSRNKLPYSVEKKVNPYVFLQNEKLFIKDLKDNVVEIPLNKIPLKGKYNYSNISAASLSLINCGLSANEIKQGILSFSGLEHRLEIVKIINDVIYVNDSKATNSDSVRCALDAFINPINLIMGGSDKNEDFSGLKSLIKEKVQNLIVLGETKEKLETTFGDVTKVFGVEDLRDAVEKGKSLAKQGDVVILSPGCASYDMFKNFEHRGKIFKKIVNDLE